MTASRANRLVETLRVGAGWTRTLGLAASLFAASTLAHADPCASLDALRWLLGDWVAAGEGRTTMESWKEVSPSTFEGVGATRTDASSGFETTETLRLVEMGGEVFYLAKTRQNALPVAFKLSQCGVDRAVFENTAHDFPKRLDYRRRAPDELLVRVSDGGDRGFELRFVREPND
jgi:hypothetical protein